MAVKLVLLGSVVCLCLVQRVSSFATGAPSGACEDLVPQHGVDGQKSASPYVIQPSLTKVKPGGKTEIVIFSPKKQSFKGFILQARVGDIPYGTFEPSNQYSLLDCTHGKRNTATHKNADEKYNVTLIWNAPAKLRESVKFTGTIAKNGGEFWIAQQSVPVLVQ
ncbi:putative defense protein [Nilaparvata lugens]|uniref:putative defense protein n=1 Tax=Nilaparvata lugens TaxID=108931 RepID=UPI00193DEB8F|nr:putative defense protein [Nilaparvata lugens]